MNTQGIFNTLPLYSCNISTKLTNMGKLVYLAMCFVFAFIVIGQLHAAGSGVHKLKSHREENEGSGRNDGDVSEESNGLPTHKKFVRNDVPLSAFAKSRKILDFPPYDCESDTSVCNEDPELDDCGPNPEGVCECIRATGLCEDSRFLR